MFKKLFGYKSTTSGKMLQAGNDGEAISNAERWFELANKVQKDDPKQAIMLHEKALPFYNDDSIQRFMICYNLCTNYINLSTPDFVKAVKYAEMAVPVARRLKVVDRGYEIFEANALHNWALALFHSNDIIKGKQLFKQAINVRKKTGQKSQPLRIYLAHTLTSFSECLAEIGEFSEAFTFLEEAVSNFKASLQGSEVEDAPDFPETIPHRLAVLLRALEGRVIPEEKYVDLAVKLQDIYMAYIKLITNKPLIFWEPLGAAQMLLGHVLGQFDLNRALKSHQSSLAVFTYLQAYYKLNCSDQLGENCVMIGYLLMLQNEFEEALEKVNEGLLYIKKSKSPNSSIIKKLTDLAGSVQKVCSRIVKK